VSRFGRCLRRTRPRPSRTTEKMAVYYYNDNWQVLCDYNDANVPRRWFAYGNYVDEVLIMSVNASPIYSYFKYYVHDHLHSWKSLLVRRSEARYTR